jgi:hypothetical protein
MNLIKQILKISESILWQITKAFLIVLYTFVFALGIVFLVSLAYGSIKELRKTYEISTVQTSQSQRKL